jgi:putative transposase
MTPAIAMGAALRLMRKLLKKQGFAPKLLVTDKLRSYAAPSGDWS